MKLEKLRTVLAPVFKAETTYVMKDGKIFIAESFDIRLAQILTAMGELKPGDIQIYDDEEGEWGTINDMGNLTHRCSPFNLDSEMKFRLIQLMRGDYEEE